MRPQDVLVLLKLVSHAQPGPAAGVPLPQKQLAALLGLSQSEVSASLRRSQLARLVDEAKQRVYPQAVLKFLCYGLRYVFPAEPGPIYKGWPTAHSAPPLNRLIRSTEPYVWPSADGPARVEAVEPLHPSVPFAARQDAVLYELLALADALRVGRPHEIALAQDLLKHYLPNG